jgi:Spy/CpxP family protein refolding chaperone
MLGGQPQPDAGREMSRGRVPAAQLLLAHTGELQLTDQQVVRLAAIARRTETRRRAMRTSMDSVRVRFAPGQASRADSAARRQLRERMRGDLDRAREQAQADQRDAIAVLTPDQQARAWEIASSRGRVHGMRRGMRDRGLRRNPGRDFRGSARMPRPPREG